jgi:hypothetical protein
LAYEKRTTAFEQVNGDDALKSVRLNPKAVADGRQVGEKEKFYGKENRTCM